MVLRDYGLTARTAKPRENIEDILNYIGETGEYPPPP